jgi:Flp pilus assembly pilin Flp
MRREDTGTPVPPQRGIDHTAARADGAWNRFRRRSPMSSLRRFIREREGLATIEYVIGAAVVLGTLVTGVSAWNNGLVARLQALVMQLQGVR